MFYLIGVDHRIQHDGLDSANVEDRGLFKEYLRNLVQEHEISLLAEESNEDALRFYNVALNSTVRLVAGELELPHRFCDPDRRERIELGIPSESRIRRDLGIENIILNEEEKERVAEVVRSYHPIREQFWLEVFSDLESSEQTLIVIGAAHTQSFSNLLNTNSKENTILNENWCYETLT